MDRADVGMVQRRGSPRLARKALERLAAVRCLLGQTLDGRVTAEPDIFGLVDDAHAPATQFGEDPVMRERLSDNRQRHGGFLSGRGPPAPGGQPAWATP